MKRIAFACLIAGAVGAAAWEAEAETTRGKRLDEKWVVKMDADHDGRVSKSEYILFGSLHMSKAGKKADAQCMERKFSEFDRNDDGFITDSDASFVKGLEERLNKKLIGRWDRVETAGRPLSFVFMDGGQADVIRNGRSVRAGAPGVTYRLVQPDKVPLRIDIVVDQGANPPRYYKCIVDFLSEDKIRMRLAFGDSDVLRPRGFSKVERAGTVVLSRRKTTTKVCSSTSILFGRPTPSRR